MELRAKNASPCGTYRILIPDTFCDGDQILTLCWEGKKEEEEKCNLAAKFLGKHAGQDE